MTIVESRAVIDGISTRALSVEGRGPTVLLLHGYTDNADTWRALLTAYAARGRRAVALDLPAHGWAGPPRRSLLAAYDSFVREACLELGGGATGREGVILVGNSLGGLLALRAGAAEPPACLRGVVAVGPPGDRLHVGLRTLPRTGRALRLLLHAPVPAAALRPLLGLTYAHACAGARLPREARAAYAEPLTRTRLRELIAVGQRLITEMSAGSVPPLVDASVPTRVLWGTRDRVCPVEGSGAFASLPITVLEGSPHCPQLSDPESIADAVDGLLVDEAVA